MVGETWAIACHQLWHWRNKQKHDDNFVMPNNFTRMIHNSVKEYGDSESFHKNTFPNP